MYSYFIKSYTVGQTLTRRLLRTITGIPGLLVDLFGGIFVTVPYAKYFETVIRDSSTDYRLNYLDGTKGSPFRVISGYPGDILGYLLGSVLGILAGFVIFVVNSILSLANWTIRESIKQVDAFSNYIADTDLFKTYFMGFENPHQYMQKAWNMGAFFFGMLLGAIPYALCKTLEFFLPLGNKLSIFTLKLSSIAGGALSSLVAMPLYPVIYFLDKLCDLHDRISNAVLKLVALVYAKTDQEPLKDLNPARDCCGCLNNNTLHSPEFRKQVNEYKPLFFSDLVFGKPEQENNNQPAVVKQ